jgi:dTDP-4-amino-4,6-dideoxygalactose transaminase
LDQADLLRASNYKISDFSCALILQRLLHEPEWSSRYREQAQRVLEIARAAKLLPLAPMDLGVIIPPHVPLLARRPIAETSLANSQFVTRKYYKPLSKTPSGNAQAIYDRIVNVPCHPDMAALRDEEISNCLRDIASGS